MRLKIRLESTGERFLTLNYHHLLSSAIYSTLSFGSREFASYLHNIGYKADGKTYKLFTFALRFDDYKITESKIELVSPGAALYVSSPLIDKFILNFVIGTINRQTITLSDNGHISKFEIKYCKIIEPPRLSSPVKFKLLSPMVLSTVKKHNGEDKQYYLRPDDGEIINKNLTSNLSNKYKLIYNKEWTGEELKLEWSEKYLSTHPRITQKITVSKIDVIGLYAPFKLSGCPELIKVGYECGFGEKNSMGFGMAEIQKN